MRWSLFFFLCACGSGSEEISDAGSEVYGHKVFPEAGPVEAGPPPIDCDAGATPSATFPATHPSLPLATTGGGPVLASPRFVPIVFAAEDRTSDIGAFMKIVGASAWWTLAAQYGVGAATGSDPIVVAETPPSILQDTDVQAWLEDKLDGTHADFGAPDPTAVYVIYYPSTTTIETTFGPSCVAFGGYHSETMIGAQKIVYSVIARCPNEAMTSITSHELFEAATDPYFYTAYAWRGVDDPSETPYGAFNDELGDLCEGAGDVTPDDIGYPVQRVWSNAASAGAHDPCQPATGPYFRTAASVPQISLEAGASATVDLVAFSDQDTGGPWTIKVTSSWAHLPDKLGLSLCRTSAQNGEHIPLVISRDPGATDESAVQIESDLGNVTTYWELDVGF